MTPLSPPQKKLPLKKPGLVRFKARPFSRDTLLDMVKKVKNNDRMIDLSLLLLTIFLLRIFRMSLMRRRFFWLLKKNIVKLLEITLLWLAGENHLQIIKLRLVLDLDAKFFLLLRKSILFKRRIKVKRLILENRFWAAIAIWLFIWLSVNNIVSSMWVVLLHHSVPLLIVIKVGLEKYQTFIPINVMFIKNNFIAILRK